MAHLEEAHPFAPPSIARRLAAAVNPGSSFTARLTLVIVLLVAATVFSATFFTVRELRSHLTQQTSERLVSRSEGVGDLVNLYFQASVGQAEVLALSDPVREQVATRNHSYPLGDTQARARVIELDQRWVTASDNDPLITSIVSADPSESPAGHQLAAFLRQFPAHSEVFITDQYGGTVAATGLLSDYNQADEEWWTTAWNDGQGAVYISQPEYDESAGVTAMLIGLPVRDATSGRVTGVLRSTLNVSTLFDLVSHATFGTTGHVELVDREGRVVAGEDYDAGHYYLYGDGTASGNETIELEGERVILGFSPVGLSKASQSGVEGIQPAVADLGWTVVAEQQADEALTGVNAVMRAATAAGILAAIVAAAVALIVARAVTRPLVKLTAASHEIGRGNLGAKLPKVGADEVGRLTASFAAMADRLGETIGSLEQRTEDLSLANERLEREAGERRLVEERIRYQAYHDTLTGLPNRALLKDRLSLAISQARRDGESVAVLFVDLDRFKMVNDTVGHSAGDEILKQLAGRVERQVREGDTVARIGGDEFTIVLPRITEASEVIAVCERVLRALEGSCQVRGREFNITGSVGVAMFPSDGDDVDALLRSADTAMYKAKGRGRGTYALFSADMSREVLERATMETELRRALEREEFVVFYQPRLDARSRELVGVEALVRWQHPDRGIVYPGDFIELAEDLGIIDRIGEFVMLTACVQARSWLDDGLPPVSVSVNLSAQQFHNADLAYTVCGVLLESGLPPELLELEITEGTAMRDAEMTVTTVANLRSLGVRISLDDFGTGYSSMSYLSRFKVDALKIDRSFIAGVGADPEASAIVCAVIDLAASLSLRTVAEGVETDAQLHFVRDRSCDEVQGFLFSRAVPAQEISWMRAREAAAPAR